MPQKCRHCGEELEGKDVKPYRHQIIEIPTLSPYVIEHQQHQLECDCCGRKTRAALPSEVPSSGYGDRLAAVVGWLSGEHRQSHRMVESLMATLFNVELSRGSINRLRQQVSEAVAAPVEQAHQYVQEQEVVHSDETSFRQGNGDGANPKQTIMMAVGLSNWFSQGIFGGTQSGSSNSQSIVRRNLQGDFNLRPLPSL